MGNLLDVLFDYESKLDDAVKKWSCNFKKIKGILEENKVRETQIFDTITKERFIEVFKYLWEGQKSECSKKIVVGKVTDAVIWTALKGNPNFSKIAAGDFFSLTYFLHEVQEIKSLEEKKLINDNENNDCHRDALKYEFLTLQKIAMQMGYRVSVSVLFEVYPPYKAVNSGLTKGNDKVVLGDWLTDNISNDERNVALAFYEAVGQFKI